MNFVPDTSRDLRKSFSKFATGITIVTCESDLGPVAITANSFTSLSLDPPLILWAVADASLRAGAFCEASCFSVHVLGGWQKDLCDQVVADGFALRDIPHEEIPDAGPVLRDCLARFDCRRVATHPAGDHSMVMGEVVRAVSRDGPALLFFDGNYQTTDML